MNPGLKLDYQEDEVVSAQKLRFLDSRRLKLLVVLGVVGTIVLSAQQVLLWLKTGSTPPTWTSPISWILVFIGTLGLIYLFAAQIDFRLNSQWRQILDLHLHENCFGVTAIGRSQGCEIAWERIKRVLENDKVYIVFWGSQQEFIILPKRVLRTQDTYFRDRLGRKVITS